MTARLGLRLLGKPQVHLDGQAITGFRTAKAEALLYYLAVAGQGRPREALANLLWGEMPEAKAKRNLTQILSLLRKRFEPFLEIEPQQVGFKPGTDYWIDVVEFEQMLEAVDPAKSLEQLRQAVDLYRGDFLQGFFVKEAFSFEEWALTERERLRELMLHALQTLLNGALTQADYAAGLDYAGRLLALEPWHETAHRQMMRLLALSGRREAALAQYETCRQVLAEALGVEPLAETTALFERLRAAASPPPHNIPPPPNVFVGRDTELQQIEGHVADPACRLLTIVGPGGIGKTRLALEAVRIYTQPESVIREPGFHDGVRFVSLVSIGAADLSGGPNQIRLTNAITSAIAEALDFSFQGSDDLLGQLLTHLLAKDLLLILDNFEHLLTASTERSAGLEVVDTLLQGAPALKVLVTSRERLNLPEERVVQVTGLAYPGQKAMRRGAEARGGGGDNQLQITNHQQYSAIALFLERARQVDANLNLTEMDAPYVIRICQLVEGLPLGLELAAGWLRMLSSQEIVTEIEQSLDFLETPRPNAPFWQRSIRAVFDRSWQMLTPPELAVFSKLSIFQGGFEREAARQVAGASPTILAGLVNKSLLRHSRSERYDMHELLRQYAAEKLWSAEGDNHTNSPTVWQRHSRYYLEWVHRREAQLRSDAPQQALAEIRLEIDNIRQAWQWAVSQVEIETLDQSLGGLSRFYDLAGLLQEGEETFRSAVAHLQTQVAILDDSTRPAAQAAIVKLLTEQARLLNRRGLSDQSVQVMGQAASQVDAVQDIALKAVTYHQWGESLCYHDELDLAKKHLEKALTWAQQAGLRNIEAEALRHLGITVKYQGDYRRASSLYQQALTCFCQLGDRRGENLTLINLGVVARKQGAHAEARRLYEQALQGFRELNYQWGQGVVLDNLGRVCYEQGDYTEAQRLLTEGLAICRGIKDRWGEGYLLTGLGNVAREQGDYLTSHSYYQQALELRREIKARQDAGYTLAEWALLRHQVGNHEAALEYSRQAESMGRELKIPELRALALTHLGHAQVALNFSQEAIRTYEQALQICLDLGTHQALETRAGLIHAYLTEQRLEQAQNHTEELLPALADKAPYGMRETFRMYLICYRVLQANQDPRAEQLLTTAHRLLHKRAAKIEDERLRGFFLEKIAAHREIVAEIEFGPLDDQTD